MTGMPEIRSGTQRAALAAHCLARVAVEPLRALPGIAQDILARRTGGRLRLTPGAAESLADHPWPGNLRELHMVLGDVAARRTAGDVTVQDLPVAYRRSGRSRRLGPLERAEHDAIAAALHACGGNKTRAAEHLGISRTTLYHRIRTLGITLPP